MLGDVANPAVRTRFRLRPSAGHLIIAPNRAKVEPTQDDDDGELADPEDRLFAVAREQYPPIKYSVGSRRTAKGLVYTATCAVKHLVTRGEATGPNGERLAKVAAAEEMIERIKLFPPVDFEYNDCRDLNRVFADASRQGPPIPRERVMAVRTLVNLVVSTTVSQAYFALHETLHKVQNFYENSIFLY